MSATGSPYDFDLITIGAGSGGVRASRLSGAMGARVAIVEGTRVGGTCVLRGCVPKKLLVYGAHIAHDLEDAAGYGWTIDGARHDWPALIAAKNQELERLEGVYHRLLREAGVTLLEGRGTVVDAHTVAVDGKTYTAERILLAMGGWPTLPDIPGIEHAITSNEALDLKELPKRVTIVGGGFIAVEFAGIFNALGAEVTLVIRAANILRGFDEDVRQTLSHELEKSGITIRRDCQVRSIEKTPAGSYSIRYAMGEEAETDLVMYATGRAPNTANLGLEEAGVKLNERGAVLIDEALTTSVPSIFALGDVTDRITLTPVATAEGRCFAERQFNNRPLVMDYENVPSAVFSMPPIGTVGLTETQARQRFGAVDVYISRFKAMKHTLSGRDERTLMKLIVEKTSDKVVGAHMVGADAPEILQGVAIALKAGATKAHFDATIGIHPTSAEEFCTMREPLPEPDNAHTE
ncbi:glutathione-disulfide reductase [Roseospirillum parvum]|uniref:Glutathione reductase n=1 Tax=Roseospirillum parvum TaxID=83401 RepID=A0A1G8CWQ1_9PROT|nr:glutathione-disulfide reductase [Roseospirillum parvum]SDH49938.1 glutathione reductase (NADPH) [Roseospirillum parvum]